MKNHTGNKNYSASFLASLNNLDEVRKFVAEVLKQLSLSDEDKDHIILAVDEAFTNSVRHAYQNSEKGIIDIKIAVSSTKIKISIIDYGKGFDPEKVEKKDITAYVKKMKRGGLGLFLIKSFMDKVDYKINPGIKNEIIMIKNLD